MKPQKLPPCTVDVPEALLRAADDAERRKDAALDRLLIKLDANGKGAALAALIDADKILPRGK